MGKIVGIVAEFDPFHRGHRFLLEQVRERWPEAVIVTAMSGHFTQRGAPAALRPLARKYFKPRITRTNVDAIIGSQGYVTNLIDNMAATGTVKLGAMEWTARSTTGENIPVGTLVKVDRIEGVKAFVTAVKVPAAQ